MTAHFDYFIVFAEMRTGSNFMERNINQFEGLRCFGEAFNPNFIGYPNKHDILGVSLSQREKSPERLLEKIKGVRNGLGGFRFFHDHDPRIMEIALDDPRCAKIILTRNPLESYISTKTAQVTGQWKLTDAKFRKSEVVRFESSEFQSHLADLQSFQAMLLNRLQCSGQTAFYIDYEDLQNVDVINGLAAFLGQSDRLKGLDKELKKQNPSPLSERVSNYDEMRESLRGMDVFDLGRTPNFEPHRSPSVPGYIAAKDAPLLYVPASSLLTETIRTWLGAVDSTASDQLQDAFTQKSLRQWKRAHPGHRSFTIVQHPVARAHDVFCRYILGTGPGSYSKIRHTLRDSYGLALPTETTDEGYDASEHRQFFLGFLEFLKSNLTGQTSIRVDHAWATQAAILQGAAQFQTPDYVFRDITLADDLRFLTTTVGCKCPDLEEPKSWGPYSIQDIYTEDIEALVSSVYRRDYVAFGFSAFKA